MGRGRTTTGMVIATLVYIHRIGASGDLLLLSLLISQILTSKSALLRVLHISVGSCVQT